MNGTLLFSRLFATAGGSPKNTSFKVFDKSSKLLQRSKFAKLHPELSRRKDYLRDEIAIKTIERLAFITRPMDNLLDFGSNAGNFLNQLSTVTTIPENSDEVDVKIIEQLNKDKEIVRSKIKKLTMLDSSRDLVYRDKDVAQDVKFPGEVVRIVSDEENFSNEVFREENQYDAVISNLSMHWINDLPETLSHVHKILKKDGFFMATLFGGDTLYELRTSLQLAELERKGGIAPRVSPLVHLNDVGSLLTRAGFSMLTIDSEDIVVGGFPDIVSVCEDLQIMGENNSILSRSYLDRDVLIAADQIYRSLHGEPEGLPATFSIVFFIGWKN
ncbi:NADH dehydrogenase [ubiquinone] 1 alpha subcomplex assembly factor 5 [Candida viswanathii]|uniref:NADH dehydrogenase [ubiquinone] 1 alpha subcomplex assembly factor 5 n=1 Tax=Candida viswanathii TaxID=5486 RepID=A0A367YJH8_9ASCO|nr:NADH dehydrogenase [ubiquinone] 1 alpha subcomplex assembly factor 5 [Candida viswanathii]